MKPKTDIKETAAAVIFMMGESNDNLLLLDSGASELRAVKVNGFMT